MSVTGTSDAPQCPELLRSGFHDRVVTFILVVVQVMSAHGDNADYSDWMKTLPESLCSVPLNHLAIPGTIL